MKRSQRWFYSCLHHCRLKRQSQGLRNFLRYCQAILHILLKEDTNHGFQARQSNFSERADTVWCGEVEGADNPVPITANFIYLRLIVDRTIRNSEFGKTTKNKDGQIAGWTKKKKFKRLKVLLGIVMASNRFEGFCSATANSLRMQLGMRELIWHEKEQKTLGIF